MRDFFDQSLALVPTFRTVLAASWQGSIAIALVLLVRSAFGSWVPARWRYALWFLVLARLLLPTFVLPRSPVSLENLPGVGAPFESRPTPFMREEVSGGLMAAPLPGRPPSIRTTLLAPARIPGPTAKPNVPSWPILAAATWLAGALASGGWWLICAVRLRRRARLETAAADLAIVEVWQSCCRRWLRRTSPEVLVADWVPSPALVGIWRPKLLLPRSLCAVFTPQDWEHVFSHEIAHLRCYDHCTQLLLLLAWCAHWFNPVVWIGLRRVRADRELAADEWVLRHLTNDRSLAYGETLFKTLAGRPAGIAFPRGLVGISEDGAQMKQRLQRITTFLPRRQVYGSIVGLAALLLLATVVLGQSSSSKIAAPTAAVAAAVPEKEKLTTPEQAASPATALSHRLIVTPENIRIFKSGDGIDIREITGTAATFQVGATYRITGTCRQHSLQNANLYIGNTADSGIDAITPAADSSLYKSLPKGSTDFDFTFRLLHPGVLHLTIYDLDNHDSYDNADAGIFLGRVVVSTADAPGAANTAQGLMDHNAPSSAHLATARVVNAQGQPVAGASIQPYTEVRGNRTQFPATKHDKTHTDQEGRFSYSVPDFTRVGVMVLARGYARKLVLVPYDRASPDIVLGAGVAVTGRLLKDGKPVPEVEIGIAQIDTDSTQFLGEIVGKTDQDGRFVLADVAPGGQYEIHAKRNSLGQLGVTASKPVITGKGGTTLSTGDLLIEPGVSVTGRIMLPDGSLPSADDSTPTPDGRSLQVPNGPVQLQVGRDDIYDWQQIDLAPDLHFSFLALPGENVRLSAWIEGYKLLGPNEGMTLTVSAEKKPVEMVYQPESTAAKERALHPVFVPPRTPTPTPSPTPSIQKVEADEKASAECAARLAAQPHRTEAEWRELLRQVSVGMSRDDVYHLLQPKTTSIDYLQRDESDEEMVHTSFYALDGEFAVALTFDFKGDRAWHALGEPSPRSKADQNQLIRPPILMRHDRQPNKSNEVKLEKAHNA